MAFFQPHDHHATVNRSAHAVFDPFFNLDRPAVVEAMTDIQERLIAGAAKTAHAGYGGIDNYTPDQDERNLMFLANRLAEIDGSKPPGHARLRAWTVNAIGYRHAHRCY